MLSKMSIPIPYYKPFRYVYCMYGCARILLFELSWEKKYHFIPFVVTSVGMTRGQGIIRVIVIVLVGMSLLL